ncbi:MAG TPA: hypothetical protein DIW66_23385 [Serratia liquefaciens]|nr:hypothetical protein [Serratia liquefaciens]
MRSLVALLQLQLFWLALISFEHFIVNKMFSFGCLIEASRTDFEKRLLRQTPVLFRRVGHNRREL